MSDELRLQTFCSWRAAIERFLSPGLGCCYRCRRPWRTAAHRPRWGREGTWKLYRFPWFGRHPVSLQMKHDRLWGIGVEPHTTDYMDGSGCFPLCQGCWAALTPTDRLPYYELLIEKWERFESVDYETVIAIRRAVYAGG